AHSARVLFENLSDRRAHWQFPRAGTLHPTAGTINLGAAIFAVRQTTKPLGPTRDDVRYVSKGLDIVDDRGFAPESADLRIRGFRPRDRAIAFERGQHRGLVAANITASATVEVEFQVESR